MIYLSAGHNLKDPGAVSGGRQENKLTIELRDLILPHLKGGKVVTDKDNETLAEYINRIQPGSGSVALEIHFNAAANQQAGGVEVLIAAGANPQSKAFATELAAVTSRTLGIKNRGVIDETQSARGRLGFLHEPAGVIALIEIGFITSPADMASYDAHKKELAADIAILLIRYEGLYN
jgi:N-acetylmuramoyl-L-alanine amidase